MILQDECGSYARGKVVRLYGSFKFTAAGTLVDTFRDGNSKFIKSVVRNSAGNYTVTFGDRFPIPSRLTTARAWVNQSATVGKILVGNIVVGSYSQANRNFIVQTTVVADVALAAYTDPAPGDPDDQARIEFELVGAYDSVGTDPA